MPHQRLTAPLLLRSPLGDAHRLGVCLGIASTRASNHGSYARAASAMAEALAVTRRLAADGFPLDIAQFAAVCASFTAQESLRSIHPRVLALRAHVENVLAPTRKLREAYFLGLNVEMAAEQAAAFAAIDADARRAVIAGAMTEVTPSAGFLAASGYQIRPQALRDVFTGACKGVPLGELYRMLFDVRQENQRDLTASA